MMISCILFINKHHPPFTDSPPQLHHTMETEPKEAWMIVISHILRGDRIYILVRLGLQMIIYRIVEVIHVVSCK